MIKHRHAVGSIIFTVSLRVRLAMGAVLLAGAASAWGVAELPRVFLDTTYHAPAEGVVLIPAGADLQAALDNAQCGQTLELTAGATYTGNFILQNKTCPPGNPLYIQTSAYSQLPGPGTRVSPANASLMPKIVSVTTDPVLAIGERVTNVRFVGIEFWGNWTRTDATLTNLIRMGTYLDSGQAINQLADFPQFITFDRTYIHGTPSGHLRRGIMMNGRAIAVIDSYLDNFHENADSQALCGWNGPGPFKIVNNHLEAAGENVMFGGADPEAADLNPADLEMRRNHLIKPDAWAANEWVVKNPFEVKNLHRALIDGNIFEKNWAGDQNGQGVVWSPHQDGTAPYSGLKDFTFTNNIVRNVGSGLVVAAGDTLFGSINTQRIVIRNNLFHNIDRSIYGGAGQLLLIAGDGPQIAGLDISHNTFLHEGSGGSCITMGDTVPVATDVTIKDNICTLGDYGFIGSARGIGAAPLNAYLSNPAYDKNVLIGDTFGGVYPPGSLFASTLTSVGFVDPANGNYRLSIGSPYRNAGTDGTDIGVDMDALLAVTAGVDSGTPSADATPPVAAMGSPANGETISGSAVTVSATASDNVGVAGVQFKLDGANLGAEDTEAPYSVNWDTTSASNGTHTLTAVARDAAGNTTTTSTVTVTVDNDVTPPTISGVQASVLSSSRTRIRWTTDEPSTTQVEYGRTTQYGSSSSLNTAPVTSHSVTLTGLRRNTLYHFRVKSRDASGNLAVSRDFTFRTRR